MWSIANEFDLASGLLTVADVVKAMGNLVDAETALGIPAANLLPICAPVSFAATDSLPPGIAAMQSLQTAVAAAVTKGNLPATFWADRIVGALNSFNDGSYLATYIAQTFPSYFPDLPFFLTEMGINISGATPPTEKGQAKFVAGQLANTIPSGNFLGRCVFQFLDQTSMKTGTEATFGMTKFDNGTTIPTGTIPSGYVPGGGDTYPVDVLLEKPLFDSVKSAYSAG
jgi:hypothetical protein